MKLPQPRQMAKVGGSSSRTNRTDERVEKRKDYSDYSPVDIQPGDASVNATKGFKHWFSTREGGLTVEATMTVGLNCERDLDSIMAAGEAASKLAEKLAVDACADMDLYIKKFMDETAS